MQDVINTVILSGLLISRKVAGALDYHDRMVIPLRIRADRTELLISQCVALFAVADVLTGIFDCIGELLHLLLRHMNNVKCQTLGGLAADAGQRRELLDQSGHLLSVVIHQNPKPPSPPRPPVSADIAEAAASSA